MRNLVFVLIIVIVVFVSIFLLIGYRYSKQRPIATPVPSGVPWAKSHGGAGWDHACSIQQTSDGGYIVAGCTDSFGARNLDSWILKLNSDSTVFYQNRYGGPRYDYVSSVQQTSDGGYIMAGHTDPSGTGQSNVWIVKLKADGTVSWQKRYGGTSMDDAKSIHQASDGGYIVAGGTYSFGAGSFDVWILKLNSDGTVAWQKTYGGAALDAAESIQQTSDGGYVAAGMTASFGVGQQFDFWVLKLNSVGAISWQKRYGGTAYGDLAYSIQQTSDGGYIVAGYTSSFGAGNEDFWVLKLDIEGAVSWQKRYGGADKDEAYSIQQTSDGGYIVAGETYSFGARASDFWVLRLNSDGTVAWQNRYGGANNDDAKSIRQTSDGGYIVAGETYSFGAGGADFWVLKLNSDGTIAFNSASGAQMANTNAVPVDTDCAVADTTATGIDTSATVTDTNATVVDTDAYIEQQAP